MYKNSSTSIFHDAYEDFDEPLSLSPPHTNIGSSTSLISRYHPQYQYQAGGHSEKDTRKLSNHFLTQVPSLQPEAFQFLQLSIC